MNPELANATTDALRVTQIAGASPSEASQNARSPLTIAQAGEPTLVFPRLPKGDALPAHAAASFLSTKGRMPPFRK
jgi:hypothetical protein